MSKKPGAAPPDHDPQSPFFPKKDKSYKSRTRKTRKTRNPVNLAKSCHSCLKKFFFQNCPTQNMFLCPKKPGAAPPITIPHPQSPFFPKKDKNYKSRTRKTRNPVNLAKSCHSCLKNFFSKTVPPKICSYVLMSKKPGAAPRSRSTISIPEYFFPKKLSHQKQVLMSQKTCAANDN